MLQKRRWRLVSRRGLPPSFYINESVLCDAGQCTLAHGHNPSSSLSTAYHCQFRKKVMSYLSILIVSCLATLSLASPVARQVAPCVWDVTGKFTLLAISNDGAQTPLVIGSNDIPTVYGDFWMGVSTLFSVVSLHPRVNEPCMERRLPSLWRIQSPRPSSCHMAESTHTIRPGNSLPSRPTSTT
jgi:hypothetical protein